MGKNGENNRESGVALTAGTIQRIGTTGYIVYMLFRGLFL